MKMKEFSDSEWDAFAGAEEFDDGSQPLYGESENGLIVVADADGIQILTSEEGEDSFWMLDLEGYAKAIIVAVAEAIPDNITEAVLEEYGFISEKESLKMLEQPDDDEDDEEEDC